jgi:hypothetical protein
MYSVEADRAKRLIIIGAAGRVTAQEVKQVAQQVREIVKDAPPGFHVLTDFRWLEAMEPASAYYIGEIMDALAAKEVGSIVRVVPDPHKDIGLNILSQFHYGAKVRVLTLESLAEALQLLTAEMADHSSDSGD